MISLSEKNLQIKKRSDEIVNETSQINVWIYVEDINESTPTFKNAQNRINVFENTPIGTQVQTNLRIALIKLSKNFLLDSSN